MGGDWIINERGEAATLSFCFENPEQTKCYGVSVGHLIKSVGESVFRFSESEPIPTPETGKKEYSMFEVGNVTSISTKTDSMVFEINLEKDEYAPMLLALSEKTHLTLDDNLFSLLLEEPKQGLCLVGFGAQRRGALGQVSDPAKQDAGEFSLVGDIGFINSQTSRKHSATYGGDSGTIFVDNFSGAPFYFHHVLASQDNGNQVSFGVPLIEILKAHQETQHLVPSSIAGRETSAPAKDVSSIEGFQKISNYESRCLEQFHTKVVPRPSSASTKVYGTTQDIRDRADERSNPGGVTREDNSLAVFNAQVKARFMSS